MTVDPTSIGVETLKKIAAELDNEAFSPEEAVWGAIRIWLREMVEQALKAAGGQG